MWVKISFLVRIVEYAFAYLAMMLSFASDQSPISEYSTPLSSRASLHRSHLCVVADSTNVIAYLTTCSSGNTGVKRSLPLGNLRSDREQGINEGPRGAEIGDGITTKRKVAGLRPAERGADTAHRGREALLGTCPTSSVAETPPRASLSGPE
jgi:hypothetical protein